MVDFATFFNRLKKRPDSSSYGPPEKFRRSDSPSALIRQAYSGTPSYSSNQHNQSYGSNTALSGSDQWGGAMSQVLKHFYLRNSYFVKLAV